MKFSFFEKFHKLELVFFVVNSLVFAYAVSDSFDKSFSNQIINNLRELVYIAFFTIILPSIILHLFIPNKKVNSYALTFLVGCNLASAIFFSYGYMISKDPSRAFLFAMHWALSYVIAILSPITIWLAKDCKDTKD